MSEYEVRIKRFRIAAAGNFKFNKQKQRQNYFDYGNCLSVLRF